MVNYFWSLLCSVLLLDQLTKWIVVTVQPNVQVLPFFSFVFVKNTGGGFGILQGNNILLLLVSIAIVAGVFWYYKKTKDRISQIGLGLVAGGALGNIIDRIIHGYVVDFLDFFIGTWHWPAFNIADSAIVIGILVLLYASYQVEQGKTHSQ